MKKYKIKLRVERNTPLSPALHLLEYVNKNGPMPEILPGQFVNILPPADSGKLLRRPISVCDVRDDRLYLMVKIAGKGTDSICRLKEGDYSDIVFPLGNGFTVPEAGTRCLLVGGGVGIAPLLYYGRCLRDNDCIPVFLLGGRTASDIPLIEEFMKLGRVEITTEDGSLGEKGFVTAHPAMQEDFDLISCCGPTPMMKAVGNIVTERGIRCEVSLENNMACGIGACLCCVQDTKDKGNQCVCTAGPVFDFTNINW